MTCQKYIELSSRNINKKLENPVGNNKVLIFDIDQCLYYEPELDSFEHNSIKSAFIELSNLKETDWNETFQKFNLFREVFHSIIGLHPRDFCEKYENHHPPMFIKKDPVLAEMLRKIKFRKFCFTNGSLVRASKILQHMELENLFEYVVCNDSEDTEFICKPMPKAFQFVEDFLGIEDRKKVYFYDDAERNIKGAKEFGWNAYIVKNNIKDLLEEHIE